MTDARWALPEEQPDAGPSLSAAASPDELAAPVRSVPRLPVFERPLTVADVLDGAFRVIKARPRVIIAIAAAVVLPVGLIVALIDFGALGGDVVSVLTDPDAFEQSSQSDDLDLGFTVMATVVTSAMITLIAAAISRVVEGWYQGRDVGAWEAISSVGAGWFAVVAAFVVVHVIEAIGTVLLVLPGIAAMALLLPVAPIVAFERAGPFAAVRRSLSLTGPRFWPVLWIALLTGLVSQTLSLMLPLLPLAIVAVVGFGGEEYVVGAATIATSLLTLPFVAAAAVVTYLDLRVRREGLDLHRSLDEQFGAAP